MTSRDHGLVHLKSSRSVPDTMSLLQDAVLGKGLRIMAHIDHAGEAAMAGLSMLATELLIFGSPALGTPLMIASPSAAIDLPLKVPVWQDIHGKVWLTYNSPDYLQERHEIPEALLVNIAGIASICEEAVR